MEEYDLKIVERSGFPAKYRRTLARYYGTLPEQARIHAHKMCLDKARSGEEAYKCLLEVLHTMKLSESRRFEHDEETERLGTDIRIWRSKEETRKKPKIKTEFIRFNYHEIKEIREKGLSWRQLATYLEKTHKVTIGFSFLRRVFTEMAYEREVDGAPRPLRT